MAKTTVLFSSK